MKKHLIYKILIILFIVCNSCLSDDNSESNCESKAINDSTLHILPIGDSRVDGRRPQFESYRFELWKLLENRNINYIGSNKDDASYSGSNFCFDKDHFGFSGYRTSNIISKLNNVQFEYKPNIALLCIGGNDLIARVPIDDIINNIETIVNLLRGVNPEIVVLIEQIAPARSDFSMPSNSPSIQEFNQEIIDASNLISTDKSKVIAVDMYSNWEDRYMADLLHYNERGASEIASRYFSLLDTLIN